MNYHYVYIVDNETVSVDEFVSLLTEMAVKIKMPVEEVNAHILNMKENKESDLVLTFNNVEHTYKIIRKENKAS